MMLKKIFGSGARVKLFRQFLTHPEEEFFIRQLTRILDEQINSLRRELENLEKIGMLKSKEKNRKKYYRVNPHFPLLSELSSIVRKTNEENEALLKQLNKVGDVSIAILGGHFVGDAQADVDIFLVGDVDKSELEALLEKRFPEAELRYNAMSKEDFLYRITLKDKFVQTIFGQSANLILKNKMKKDTEQLLATL